MDDFVYHRPEKETRLLQKVARRVTSTMRSILIMN